MGVNLIGALARRDLCRAEEAAGCFASTVGDNPWDLPTWLGLTLLGLWAAKPVLLQTGAEARSRLLIAVGTLIMPYRSLRFVAEPLLLGGPCIAIGLALRLQALAPRARQALGVGLTLLALAVFAHVGRDFPPYQPVGLGVSPRNLPMQPGRWLAAHRRTRHP
ncbi:MAG TPA: hypothetical protein VF331_20745, partial [Polyangiales bacterium]